MLYSNIKHCKSNTVNEKNQRKENKLRAYFSIFRRPGTPNIDLSMSNFVRRGSMYQIARSSVEQVIASQHRHLSRPKFNTGNAAAGKNKEYYNIQRPNSDSRSPKDSRISSELKRWKVL